MTKTANTDAKTTAKKTAVKKASTSKATTNKTPAKTEVKKVAKTVKSAPKKAEKKCTCKCSCLVDSINNTCAEGYNLIKLWLDGWKKSFNIKGRSSRYELWTFVLFNSILMLFGQLWCRYHLSSKFVADATAKGMSLEQIDTYVTYANCGLYLFYIIPAIPICTLLIRRMHDLGLHSWNGYLEPLFKAFIASWLLFLLLTELQNTDFVYTAMLAATANIVMFYAIGFYGIKFLITTLFYSGDKADNQYGKAQYNTDEYENKALNFSCLYFLFITTIGLFYLIMFH